MSELGYQSLHFPQIICLSYRIYTHMHATSHVTRPKGDPIQLLEVIQTTNNFPFSEIHSTVV